MWAARFRRTLSIVLATLAIGATQASAEPITAVYDVQLFERFLRQDAGPGVMEPFDQHFTLSMTIDPASAVPGAGVYGMPSFSAVPLSVPRPPDDLVLSSSGSTTHIPTSGGAFARANASKFASGTIDGNLVVYSVGLQLGGPIPVGTEPSIATAETFPLHLDLARLGSFGPYNFSYSACLGLGPFPPSADSCTDARGVGSRMVTYLGTATLSSVELEPIPEPATLALVGSGLALLVRRTHRKGCRHGRLTSG